MRILGIDPGSLTTGFGLIERDGQRRHYVASGCIRLSKYPHWPDRLKVLYDNLSILFQQYTPTSVAMEQVFVHKNVSSALKLGQTRGAVMVAIAAHPVAFAEYTPRAVKKAVVGYGNADKNQVQQMITSILHLNKTPQADAADALAIALCHANTLNQIFTR